MEPLAHPHSHLFVDATLLGVSLRDLSYDNLYPQDWACACGTVRSTCADPSSSSRGLAHTSPLPPLSSCLLGLLLSVRACGSGILLGLGLWVARRGRWSVRVSVGPPALISLSVSRGVFLLFSGAPLRGRLSLDSLCLSSHFVLVFDLRKLC